MGQEGIQGDEDEARDNEDQAPPPVQVTPGQGEGQAGEAGMVTIRYESELACFKENLNQVSSVSLLMTSSPALANEGLFELTRRPC